MGSTSVASCSAVPADSFTCTIGAMSTMCGEEDCRASPGSIHVFGDICPDAAHGGGVMAQKADTKRMWAVSDEVLTRLREGRDALVSWQPGER